MWRMALLFSLVSCVCGPFAELAMGQSALSEGIIHGKIMTENGSPVPGFPVILESADSSIVALTDESGDYIAKGLQPGQYKAIGANNLGNQPGFEITNSGDLSGDVIGSSIETIVIPHNW